MQGPKSTLPPLPQPEEAVVQIPLSELYPFPNQPFKIRDDDAMRGMLESVREYGVLTPAIVRSCETGGYEIVAGHRRKHASEVAGLETMPAIVREMDNDTAIILMVDSNIQRENVLPSEKAAAYKMKMDAIKRKGQRTDLTLYPLETKLDAATLVGQEYGESRAQVFRLIRLTHLIPEIQQMVDNGKVALHSAVELSYLPPEEQSLIAEVINSDHTIPTLQQAQQMKKASQKGGLDRDAVLSIMTADTRTQAEELPPGPPPVNSRPRDQP